MKTPKVLFIPKGSINKIITQLQGQHYDVSSMDVFFLRMIGQPQTGWIDVGANSVTKVDFLYKLTHGKAALQNITLIPGETTAIFLEQVAKKLYLDIDKLQVAYNSYFHIQEGGIVPNTYNLPIGITEEHLMKILYNQSFRQILEVSHKLFGKYQENKWFRYVAIASVIQKEAANEEEMPIISSVIYNRLKKGMYLQMDGTLNYGKYSHVRVTAQRIKEDTSLYNTYKHKGVPPIPVCNVSFAAITAAVFPEKTDYLYFMKSKSGTHDFTCNYSTHLTNIKRATK